MTENRNPADSRSLLDAARVAEIRELVTRWMTEPEPHRPGHETCVRTLPASPDDVLYLLDLVEHQGGTTNAID